MRSQLAVRLGVQEPQIVHLPPDVHSLAAADEAIELADAYGIADGHPLDESQRFTLRAAMGERRDGSWAAATVGDFKPRQGGGKTDTIAAREFAGLLLLGEQLIIHTAHEFPTANESFLRLVAVFENFDDLRKKVARIRFANGEQGIELLSGQRLKYRARTGGSGRGFTKADLVVYDEAQHLQAEHVAASGPARLASPNSQSWYAGSGGFANSKQAWAMRRRALLGNGGRLAYVENTAERVQVVDGKLVSERPDPYDREAWAAANPGLNRWVAEETMADLLDELGPELFARECLCVWDPEPIVEKQQGWQVITEAQWAAKLNPEASPFGDLGWAVDAAPDGRSAAIACSDGVVVEVVDHREGIAWAPARLKQLQGDHRFAEVAIDTTGPAGALVTAFDDLGVAYRKVTLQEHAQACGGLLEAVTGEASFEHRGQPPLTAAVESAARRHVTDVWLWTRSKSSGDISPLVAVGLARWWALNQVTDDGDFIVI